MDSKENINDLLARYFVKEKLTEKQQNALDFWISANKEEFKRLESFMQTSQGKYDTMEFDASRAWENIDRKLVEKSAILKIKSHISIILSAAACILLALVLITGLFMSNREEYNNYANTGSVIKSIWLPDSSEVMLYPDATLQYSQSHKSGERLAKLDGKAFFNVRKKNGLKFKVKTEKLEVEVLGTSFLVNATPAEQIGVFVKTGKVRVSSETEEAVITANEKAEFIEGNIIVGSIENPHNYFIQDTIILIFEKTLITDAVREIEQKTGIRIDVGEGLENNMITTRIDSVSGENIVRELAFLCRCRYEILEEGKYYRLYNEQP